MKNFKFYDFFLAFVSNSIPQKKSTNLMVFIIVMERRFS